MLWSRKFRDMPIVIIEQGGIAERSSNAIEKTIDNMTTLQYFLNID